MWPKVFINCQRIKTDTDSSKSSKKVWHLRLEGQWLNNVRKSAPLNFSQKWTVGKFDTKKNENSNVKMEIKSKWWKCLMKLLVLKLLTFKVPTLQSILYYIFWNEPKKRWKIRFYHCLTLSIPEQWIPAFLLLADIDRFFVSLWRCIWQIFFLRFFFFSGKQFKMDIEPQVKVRKTLISWSLSPSLMMESTFSSVNHTDSISY